MNLSPETLKAINDWYTASNNGLSQSSMRGNAPYTDPTTGQAYQQDDGQLVSYDPSHSAPGQNFQKYSANGSDGGTGQFQNPNKMDIGTMIALGLITGGAAGAFSGGLGGINGIGASAGAGGANGGVLSKAALDGTTAFGANSVPGAYELGSGASSLGGTFNAAQDSQLFNAANPEALSGYQAAGATPGAVNLGSAASSTPGWMDAAKSLIPSGASGLLQGAAGLVGALAGSKGVQKNVTDTKKMDPRLDGAVYGDQGLVPRSQALLAQQMSPQGQAGWQNMKQMGQGLLSNPIAGNGYAQFAGRKF